MKSILFTVLGLLVGTFVFGQNFTISGYVSDLDNGEKLIGANVFDAKKLKGNVTNVYGFYSLTLPQDSVYLAFSYIGYETKVVKIYLDKDIDLNVELSSAVSLNEVVVSAEKNAEKIEEQTQMSRVEVPVEQIKKLPAFLGEVDILKTLQLLPGVQSGGEGQSGLYVRGGSPDQNLILLDGVPVYNASHLLGFFSVFNADAVKNVTLTKGGYPARYGGRLSSVLEINMKEGNMKEFDMEGSIGTVASKLTLEGPIIKDKLSYIISGRRTYIDVLARPFINAQNKQSDSNVTPKLFFYDLNAKLNYKINDDHHLYLSTYWGSDVFGIESEDTYTGFRTDPNTGETIEEKYTDIVDFGIDWGNKTTAMRWNYKINNKTFLNTTATHSNYQFNVNTKFTEIDPDNVETGFVGEYNSSINDFGLKVNVDYIPTPEHYIRYGMTATHHKYTPGVSQFKIEDPDFGIDTTFGGDNIRKAMEYTAYVEDDFSFGSFKANVGLHLSAFDLSGSDAKPYFSIQPRLGVRYLLPNKIALKASFATMTQFVNLLTNDGINLPTDLWVPSTENVKPQESWQVAVGGAKTIFDDYEISVEGYYKKMKNLISYKEGANFLFSLETDWENKITQGEGDSYGAEFFLQKKLGKTTGWLGYTLSWSNRQFDLINDGEKYPYKYDRRHDISVVVSHDIKRSEVKDINLSATWVFGTGNSITLPVYHFNGFNSYGSIFNISPGNNIETGGSKNGFRMAPYHRMDFSATFSKRKKYHTRSWVFSIYNIYNRANPFFVYTANEYDDQGNREKKFKQVSLFRIIPSIAYKFSLN